MKSNVCWIAAAVLAGLLLAAVGTRAATLTNANGATVEILTTEADSGGVGTNANGATLEVVGADQASLDDRNGLGAKLFVGLIDPDPAGNAARLWALYE